MDVNINNLCQVCQKQATQKCGECEIMYYCSKQHQKDDWKLHKPKCKPFKIHQDATIGRYLIATRTLKPGDVIIKEFPLVWGPSQNSIPICLGCGKKVTETNSRPCFKCGWPICGDLCEKSPAHLPECQYIYDKGERVIIKNFATPHPLYRYILILRCLYQKQFLTKNWKKLEILEAHHELRKNKCHYENDRVTIAEFTRRFFKLSSYFTDDDIMRIHGIIMINSHEVPLSQPPHLAIYDTTSLLEHNCTSNCQKSFTNNGQIVITAASDISEGDHLSICYTDPLWGTPNRRQYLNETKLFWCQCLRCQNPTEFKTNFSALKCQNLDCNGAVLPSTFTGSPLLPWHCDKCNYFITSNLAYDILEQAGNDLCNLNKNDQEACEMFLGTYKKYLHNNHFYYIKVKYFLITLLGLSDEDLALKMEICNNLSEIVPILAPAEKQVLDTIYFELHKSFVELASRNCEKFSELLKESHKKLLQAMKLKSDIDIYTF